MKFNNIDFDLKRRLIISINNDVITESLDINSIHKFDRIFTNISYEEIEYDTYLYCLWNDIKLYINKYYKKDKKILNSFLGFINIQLSLLSLDSKVDRKKIKIMGGKNEKE